MSKPLPKKGGLGKGLGAILSDNQTDNQQTLPSLGAVNILAIARIETNPFQPRTEFDSEALQELSDSIKQQGIIQPITVRKVGENDFQLISGERRLRAAKLAGLTEIPAYIRTANDEQMLEMALIENIQREDLNPVEIALSYRRMIDELGLQQEELGEKVGKNRATVANFIRLLKLPPEIQAALRDKVISTGHAKAVLALETIDKQLVAFKQMVEKALSVRQTEALVKELMTDRKETPKIKPRKDLRTLHLDKVKEQLEDKFSGRVELAQKANGKGEIRIHFMSDEDLNRILELLG